MPLILITAPAAACHLELQLQPAPLQLQAPVAAIPEPASWAMLLAGLAVLGWVARRRRAR